MKNSFLLSPLIRSLFAWFIFVCGIQYGFSQVVLRGNVIPNGEIKMASNNGRNWKSTVTLDDSQIYLFRDKYVFFDDVDNNYQSDNIKINGGTYSVEYNSETKDYSFSAPVDEYRISGFGSSVMNGENPHNKSYVFYLGELLEERYKTGKSSIPFYTSNISIGGNKTESLLSRYDDLTRDHSRYVMLGLSMGNEGLAGINNDKNAVFERFRTNMETLVQKIKDEGKIPIVMNNYPRGGFSLEDYKYVKDINILIHQWDCASVNILGTVDDGTGNWAPGFVEEDNQHPNTDGYQEILCSIPPSLFDALVSGKKQPARDASRSMALQSGNGIMFRGEGTVHSFTISLVVMGGAGSLLTYKTTDGFSGEVSIDENGHVVYNGVSNQKFSSNFALDNKKHLITLTHYYGRKETILYVDKEAVGSVKERINSIGDVFIGDKNPSSERLLCELFFWRSALTHEEVASVVDGKMLKSSLELYVPTESSTSLTNLAMSTNTVQYSNWSSFNLGDVDKEYAKVVEVNGVYYHLIKEKSEAEVVEGDNKYGGNIVIPEIINYDGVKYKVTSIGKLAFYDCSDLLSIDLPESLEIIDDFAFHGCQGLTSIDFPNSLVSIGNNAFARCEGLTKVILHSNLRSVGNSAFYGCNNLLNIEIPKRLSSLGYLSFAYCTSLPSIISFPDAIDTFSYDVFQGCSTLTSLVVPNCVSKIESGCFSYCTGITSIEIPNSVTYIDEYSFYRCSSCKSVSIGCNVTYIGIEAFALCSSVTDFYCFADKVPDTHRNAFNNSNMENATLFVPLSSIDEYKKAYPWKYFKSIEPLPTGETGIIKPIIENNEFDSCNQIHSIYTIDGKRVENYKKGLNIVRLSNGKTRIVIK